MCLGLFEKVLFTEELFFSPIILSKSDRSSWSQFEWRGDRAMWIETKLNLIFRYRQKDVHDEQNKIQKCFSWLGLVNIITSKHNFPNISHLCMCFMAHPAGHTCNNIYLTKSGKWFSQKNGKDVQIQMIQLINWMVSKCCLCVLKCSAACVWTILKPFFSEETKKIE